MMNLIHRALTSMGYRRPNASENPGKWMKPVGFHVFSYEEDRNELTNWFLSAQNTLERWHVASLYPDDEGVREHGSLVQQIQHWEAYHGKADFAPSSAADFEFLTKEEFFSDYL